MEPQVSLVFIAVALMPWIAFQVADHPAGIHLIAGCCCLGMQLSTGNSGKAFIYTLKNFIADKTGFFSVMELAAKRFGCKLFVIDNLMSILEENADSLYSDQANFIQRCKDFAVKNWVHLVLLAHPSKAKGEIQNARNGNLDKTDISGSNNIANKADNIIAVERNWGDDREWDEIITSLKDRESGQRKVMRFYFSQETLRFYNERTAERKDFGWEKYLMQETPDPNQCPF